MAILFLIGLTAASCAPTAGDFNVRGNAVYAKGDYDDAIRLYRRSLALNSNLPAVNANLGWAYLNKKNYDEAVVYLRRALSIKPGYKSALEGLGRSLYGKGDYKAAINQFKRALEINANNLEAKTWLGFAYFREGRFSDAEKLLGGFGAIGAEIRKHAGGLFVVRTLRDSPAARAGLRAGDIVRSINGETVKDLRVFIRKIRGAGIGGRVALGIQRGETTTIVTVTPGKNPKLAHPAFDQWLAKRYPGRRWKSWTSTPPGPPGPPGPPKTVARVTRPAAASGWRSSGTGFLLRGTTHILTKFHVVEGAERVRVTFPSGEVYPGRVEARDANNDLAIIRLKGMPPKGGGFVPDLGSRVEPGERIHAIGYPLGAGLSRKPSIVSGQVSAATGLNDNIAQFRMTAPINEGNSGGPVINARGVLIGIASSGLVQQGVEAIRFATKISAAALLLGQTRLARKFSISVQPKEARPKTPQAIFREFSPYVVLIETR